MITESTLEAVKLGILTDEQLKEAIDHYNLLERYLSCHGLEYRLVWKDVYMTLITLQGFAESRKRR